MHGPDADTCKALGNMLDRVGDQWTVMVVGMLSGGAMRFNALQRAVPGVSHRMLTLALRGLERDGLVKRIAFATVPPKVEYGLTPLGLSLKAPLEVLAKWVQKNRSAVELARSTFDQSD
ncbi:transcriptional regulator [Xanthomonas citri pv. vignicola]|uniref:Transcriptional regulator n=1 Tax=Xanthomonas citri pv. vignicola TaxID=473426 RepID=A0AB33CLW7_XANCI|nr:transcriptional regulator [Xanthomonas citri pv. vignicola]